MNDKDILRLWRELPSDFKQFDELVLSFAKSVLEESAKNVESLQVVGYEVFNDNDIELVYAGTKESDEGESVVALVRLDDVHQVLKG